MSDRPHPHSASPAPHTDRIAIIGSMGAGKTTVARLVAARLDLELFDSDAWIERETGASGSDYAEVHGVAGLHALERAMLERTLVSTERFVVTPAASVVDDPESRQLLQTLPLVVWIDVDPDVSFARAGSGTHRRRVSVADYRRLHSQRERRFRSIADVRLDGERSPEALADTVVRKALSRA